MNSKDTFVRMQRRASCIPRPSSMRLERPIKRYNYAHCNRARVLKTALRARFSKGGVTVSVQSRSTSGTEGGCGKPVTDALPASIYVLLDRIFILTLR
jgi:hypothetical protein